MVARTEQTYRGPHPSIPYFSHRDPCEFARLKIALENLLPTDGTELFKYQILVDHLKLEEAKLIADSYLNSPTPYSDTLLALNEKFGQPHKIALSKIASVLDSPDVRRGDIAAFERFALHVQSLVGLLKTLGADGEAELRCGSHVARLLGKLPPEQRADFRRCTLRQPGTVPTLLELANWLKHEAWCQDFDEPPTGQRERHAVKSDSRQRPRTVTVLHGSKGPEDDNVKTEAAKRNKGRNKHYCPFCENDEHFLSQCSEVTKLSKERLTEWIKANKRCWRCARPHQAAQCDLKKPCGLCQGKHLEVLHEVNVRRSQPSSSEDGWQRTPATEVLYVDRHLQDHRVLLKCVQVLLRHGKRTISTYAILDDGSERTMLLSAAARELGLRGTREDLPLRTIRQDVQTLPGSSVSFRISPVANPKTSFRVSKAFTASRLGLADQSYPMDRLQKRYPHLAGIPITSFQNANPLVLIGSDHPHLITAIEPVRLGRPGGPAAIRTRLGWALQGPAKFVQQSLHPQQCLLTSVSPLDAELYKHVERLWQLDTLPFRSEKVVTRSKQDEAAVALLEEKTIRLEVAGILRYATPLLRKKDMPVLYAPKETVLPSLRSTERRLAKDPEFARAYSAEIQKLVDAGSVSKLRPDQVNQGGEEWYIPHHMVSHHGKNRIVYNCSYRFRGQSLNDSLLPGPTLGPSLLGVLLRFREHTVALSADITRGKSLQELVKPNRWSQGPPFLLQPPEKWPVLSSGVQNEDVSELRKSTFCGAIATKASAAWAEQHDTWQALLEPTVQELHGAADQSSNPTAEDYRKAEGLILQRAQQESFPDEVRLLKVGKPVSSCSSLITLSPEMDSERQLICVGGRLRRAESLEPSAVHPVVLDPSHPSTRLLIQDYDSRLHHPGPERVFAEIRRSYWILRGREAVRRYQHSCPECRRWKAKPAIPKMADLPPARLRLFKPAFFSTGMDCFGPFQVKVGRRIEKRWGIIFKCLTTRGVHLDLLNTLDVDSFLMALRRFIARRGTPAELYSDQGTNFRGGERELRESFAAMSPDLQEQLAKQKISFHFNPPAAPHFGGVWEREIRSVKAALYPTVGAQPVPEEVLRTVLLEVEGILNSKPLGYVSSSLHDPDPVTPNVLLMGRLDGSLPQTVYPETALLSRRRWKHSQILANHFWSSFLRNYLPSLQTRQKWQSTRANITDGAVVLLVDPQSPRATWPVGLVISVNPSADGQVRSAVVRVGDKEYTRPVARLVTLPAVSADNEEDNAADKNSA
ncbi:uncharacterized protein LOC130918045 [Corythoichthys intestinalis]|uniref:uncharacterized protein LOC130918045 n=1 Tax=Corythoichthys intestinalis TaxID=161448 RepID=UPI0025A67682|nr:uncharacterized protein LOC130918045 [Corythoichthys intestinalis]